VAFSRIPIAFSAFLLTVALSCTPLRALERLSFVFAKDVPRALRQRIRDNSVLTDLQTRGNADTSATIAAALSDYRRILELLYADARYSGQVSIRLDGREVAELPPFAIPPRIRHAEVRVNAGPPFIFAEIAIAPLPPGLAPTAADLPKKGDTAGAGSIRKALDLALEAWRRAGHAEAALRSQNIIADHATHRLHVRITIDPGPRFTFGTLLRSPGGTDVPVRRMRRVAGLPEGAGYDPESLEDAADRLRRTGAFRVVSYREIPRSENRTVDMEVLAIEEKPRRMGAGIELSTPDGLSVSGFWLHRNLRNNLERLRIEGELRHIGTGPGNPDAILSARFEHPAVFGADTMLHAGAEAAYLQEPFFEAGRLRLDFGLSRKFGAHLSVETGLRLSFSRTRDDLGRRDFTELALPIRATLDRRDDPLDPATGQMADLELLPFTALGDGTGGMRARIDARAYRLLGERGRTVLAGRLQFGTLLGPALTAAPPDYLFHSGGGGTVRGHSYRSLGITLPSDERLGGRSFLGASLELRHQLKGPYGIVAFADFGWVGEGPVPSSSDPWHAGAGLGLRYQTPVGPIRLDLAVPVHGESDSAFQLYIGIGQAF